MYVDLEDEGRFTDTMLRFHPVQHFQPAWIITPDAFTQPIKKI